MVFGTQAPGIPNTIGFPYGEPGGPVDLNGIERGEWTFCIYAKLTYNDIFKGTPTHTTEFCGVLDRDKTHFQACKHNNNAD